MLFNHACRVEPYALPDGTVIDFNMGWESDDDYDDGITVSERVPPEKKEESRPEMTIGGRSPLDLDAFEPGTRGHAALNDDADDDPDRRALTLRLDVNGIRVLRITSVKYEHHARSVSRHRTTNDRPRRF